MNLESNNNLDNSFFFSEEEPFNKLDKEDLKNYSSRPDYLRNPEELLEELEVKRKYVKYLESQMGITRKKKPVHLIYVSTIALIFISIFIFKDINTVSEKETFEKYYSNFKENDKSTNAILAFVNKDYPKVNTDLSDSLFINGRFLNAISLIEVEHFKEACHLLSTIDTKEAEWLNALCLLRLKKNIEAKELLEKIYREKDLFSKDAKGILEKHYYTYKSN